MAVVPPHDDLDDVVQPIQGNARRHRESPPYFRLDMEQPYFQQIKPFFPQFFIIHLRTSHSGSSCGREIKKPFLGRPMIFRA
jgi:hypothetical protein